ncbi:MAG: tetratricopeptide repeat protein [Desulfobacterales bacterium]|nr:MAG: tetratricopeptide repeat protein [Desulfobacterales bacterium]
MSRKLNLLKFAIVMLALSFIFSVFRPVSATPIPGETPDIIIKINDLEKNLNLLDEIFGAGSAQTGASFSAQIRQLLQSTNWIDHSRAIVIGVVIKEPQPIAAALIPFQQPNEAFRAIYSASAEKDYYILPLPPGQPVAVSDAFKSALNGASRSKRRSFVTIDIGLRRLMQQSEQQIRQMFSQFENMPEAKGVKDMPLSPQEVQEMTLSMLDIAAQLEMLTIRLDLSKEKLSISTEARPASESKLAKLFVSKAGTALLSNYTPSHDINFRSRSHDYSGFIEIFEESFGKIYEKMGFDFSEIAAIMKHYTGEMVGGFSFGQDAIQFEGIDVLKDPKMAATFVESIYLPWIEAFTKKMTQKMEELSGQKIEAIFVRAEESRVAGHKVYGAKFKFPSPPTMEGEVSFPGREFFQEFEWRFTTVDRYFIYAADDKKLAKLIKVVKTLKPQPAEAELITMDFNLYSYFDSFLQAMPEGLGLNQPLPKLGRMYMTFDFKNGRAVSTSSIRMKDIKNMIAYFTQAFGGATQASLNFDDADEKPPQFEEDKPEQKKAEAENKNDAAKEKATHWFKKGALCATYGNDQAAIKYFEKAIALDPEHSGAYFEKGISYGQLGEYQKAIPLLNKAIQMEPQNGLYYYGRGRVYLLSGDKDKAMEDFNKAADLGDDDATNYLEYIGQAKN